MAIPANQIGRGTEENLLWQISKQLEALTGVTYNSKKYILNVTDPYYNNPNTKVQIETYSGVWLGNYDGATTPPFLEIDLNDCSSFSMDFSAFSFAGYTQTGTYNFSYNAQAGQGVGGVVGATSGIDGWTDIDIAFNINDNIVSFYFLNYNSFSSSNAAIEVAYTLKKYKLPMRFD